MGRIRTSQGFLSRLARDMRGNTIALMAAALMPLAGLIGGGVDMSRLYLTKTRLQQACDAGALAGRKAMGAGAWTTGTGSTNAKAEAMFAGNFKQGDYGTGTLTMGYAESNGVVTGTVGDTVPMTIMRVFGMQNRTINVTCTAKMEIPNTDVMFVLDTTGSMMCAPAQSTCYSPAPTGTSKIEGLRSAIKCFYEALEKVNTTEVCGNDPTATTASTTAQIRIGFVPYSVNVNVGRLLPNSYFVDNWTYQSRVATTATVHAWALGSQSATTWGSWSATPDSFSQMSGYGSFSNVSSSSYTMADGTVLAKNPSTANTSAKCTALNSYGSYDQIAGIQESLGSTGSASTTAADNNPPVYPATVQNENVTQSRTNTVTLGFKYNWSSSTCTLQSASKSTGSNANKYTQTQNGTATKPITWTDYANVIQSWTYQPVSLNVSGLKAGNSTWNNTVSLPIGYTTGASVKLSGSSSSTTLQIAANTNVTWDGCIEERQTYQSSNPLPATDWATIPSTANDLNIDLVPNATAGTKWAPLIGDAEWGRYSSSSCSWLGCTYTKTSSNYSTTADLDHNNNYSCPTAARKLTVYNTPASLESYVDSLTPAGATYHDIGMLWGARLLSPTGIFASENAFTPSGRPIQRHLIFMTDGDTNTSDSDYSAYGIGYYDQRQTNYDPTDTQMDDMTNARLVALCTAVKNMNVTLWVISYGGGVNSTTEDRLRGCATTSHYYAASDNAALISRFRQIAADISELRLTS